MKMAIKISTGIIIVPLTIAMTAAWPWWTNASIPVRIMTAAIILPLTFLAAILAPWWEGF